VTKAMRAISDHIRAIVFLIADGVIPSNEKRGYVLRRLIRRAMLFGRTLHLNEPFLYELAPSVSDLMGDIYPEVMTNLSHVQSVLKEEETKFNSTLKDGLYYLENAIESYKKSGKQNLMAKLSFTSTIPWGCPLR